MFQPKIVFFDIDDTLWIKNEQRIPDSTKIALKKLREKGIITAIATGRTIAVLPEPIKALAAECGIEMFVSINGQYVEYKGKKLISFPLSQTDVEKVIQIFQKNQVSYAFVARSGLWVSHVDDDLQYAVGALNLPFVIEPNYFKNNEVYQMLGFFPVTKDKAILPVLPDSLRSIRWHTSGLDFIEKQGSKARGIQAALSALGLTMADAMAFGDELNDLEMIQAVGFGVAMGNGVAELKAVANYVAPCVDEDGIYRALMDLHIID
ncbi:Cof-type HAD-IIB family hydrolase [Simonsiella muelleri]|uniref:Cof-like hydrolase n=1 Tax=Simonsiella muelleri ATCC 29453 TaxID=641147 RepID=V9H5V8_9NEIS|nr:Cof-type HAD-IIB family hydrolase [Simonsiella muelleri]AUX61075.1 HAD family hydrolase [Simonsiella muelleri ATCC 29453]EFG30872.1 cof-like hydrolase [Simonsiella muelleri ATCC 29453]UBQ53122.1 Cof-type HAD-IIB family hydrolase [Simonsiella muelleri]